MKYALSLLLSICLAFPSIVFAQAPAKFNYQGVARDASGNVLANQAIGLQFTLLSGSPTGTTELIETHTTTTNMFGLFNVVIGDGTNLFVNPAMDLGTASHYLKVELDATGGTNYLEMGTSQLLSVPYAIYAATSGNGEGPAGPMGATGPQGPTGASGATGAMGITGAQGPTGEPGVAGTNGVNGATGPQGATGPSGSAANAIFSNTLGVTSNENGSYASDNFVFGSPQLDFDGIGDHQSRMFFDKTKSAFRAGTSYIANWNATNVGTYSVGLGYGTKASGVAAVALGSQTQATGSNSTALGISSNASGFESTAIGSSTKASGAESTAMGLLSEAKGYISTAMGEYTVAESSYETTIGRFDTDYTPIGVDSWHAADRLFVIGNGTFQARSDALVMLKSGATGLGISTPSYLLHVNGTAGKPGGGSWTASSDRRLKQNITPYTEGLAQLLAINPVKYQYNKLSGYDTTKEYVGVIAQELKEIAPYMVGTFKLDDTEYYDVDNSAMMYMLINSVKEQQALIEQLKKEVEELKKNQR